MKQSDLFRDNAENCLQLAERAEGQPAFRRYLRMAQAWMALANEQDWLGRALLARNGSELLRVVVWKGAANRRAAT